MPRQHSREAGFRVLLILVLSLLAIFLHPGIEPCNFAFPEAARGQRWRLFIDTGAQIYPELNGPPADFKILLPSRSLVCYVSEPSVSVSPFLDARHAEPRHSESGPPPSHLRDGNGPMLE